MFFKRKKSWHVVTVDLPKHGKPVSLDTMVGVCRIRCLETTLPVMVGSDDGAEIPVRHREPMPINADSRDVFIRATDEPVTVLLIIDG